MKRQLILFLVLGIIACNKKDDDTQPACEEHSLNILFENKDTKDVYVEFIRPDFNGVIDTIKFTLAPSKSYTHTFTACGPFKCALNGMQSMLCTQYQYRKQTTGASMSGWITRYAYEYDKNIAPL